MWKSGQVDGRRTFEDFGKCPFGGVEAVPGTILIGMAGRDCARATGEILGRSKGARYDLAVDKEVGETYFFQLKIPLFSRGCDVIVFQREYELTGGINETELVVVGDYEIVALCGQVVEETSGEK